MRWVILGVVVAACSSTSETGKSPVHDARADSPAESSTGGSAGTPIEAGPAGSAGSAGVPALDAGEDAPPPDAQIDAGDASCPEALCASFSFQGFAGNCLPEALVACFGGNVAAVCHEPDPCKAGVGGQYPEGCKCLRLNGSTVTTCTSLETPGLTCTTGAPEANLICLDCTY